MEPKTLLGILEQASKLKINTRHCNTIGDRLESVADHSWRTALMAMMLTGEKEFETADINRVIRMCLIHDLGESFTGDIPTFEKNETDEKNEEIIYLNWVNSFPSPQKEEWLSLIDEMGEQATVESKIFKAIDKLEAVISHNEADISTWLPLEYDLQLNHGKENVKFSDYFVNLKKEIDEITLKKINKEENADNS